MKRSEINAIMRVLHEQVVAAFLQPPNGEHGAVEGE